MAEEDIAMEVPQWFLRISVLILILIVIVAGISLFLSREIDVKDYESRLLTYKIYSCLSYDNHFGIIDSSKLDNLEKCVNFGDMQLNIKFLDIKDNQLNEKFVNKDKFNKNWPLCNVKFQNENEFCYSKRDYLIMDNEPVILNFSIIIPEQGDLGIFKAGFGT
ncbi:MAG: hypothetical protein KJ623_04320 [Nanoarchaeota archaeon]|nr:hypothetical protein [Nanoarchaeota archaeon]MBU0962619.1 hypothetical protein [Nanoarchaeota archaeon]